jgi:pSer/pThr/pTyr-binding forkhead associated (FHA) protein
VPKSYRITILNGPDRGKTYYLTSPGAYAFGRAPANHIVLEGGVISKVHGEFIRDAAGLIIRDAGSRNGVLLHGKRIHGDYRVEDRCGVQVGRYKLKIEPTDEVEDPDATRLPIDDNPEDRESQTPATGDQPFNSLATMPLSSDPSMRTTRAVTPRNAGTTRRTGTGSGSGTGSRSGSSGASQPTTGKGDYGSATRDEILFGRVAEGLGFVTPETVDEAVRFQEEGGPHKLLGQVMLQMEVIDGEQLDEIIRTQRDNWSKIDMATGRPRSEVLFGVLAVKLGCCGQRDVNFAVRAQAKAERDGISVQLGRILVQRKSITEEDSKRITQAQGERHPVSPIPGYEFMAKLGQGGMGTVYKARQISLDRIVAIKVLPLRLAQDEKYVARFLREARAVAKLNHVNIVGGIDAGTVDGNHFFVMEYVDGTRNSVPIAIWGSGLKHSYLKAKLSHILSIPT